MDDRSVMPLLDLFEILNKLGEPSFKYTGRSAHRSDLSAYNRYQRGMQTRRKFTPALMAAARAAPPVGAAMEVALSSVAQDMRVIELAPGMVEIWIKAISHSESPRKLLYLVLKKYLQIIERKEK